MARKTIIAGNWKMNLLPDQAKELVNGVKEGYSLQPDLEVVFFPQNLLLGKVLNWTQNSPLQVGSQNCYDKISGAYTGENSPELIRELGCTYSLLGHSERREYFNETNEFVASKAKISAAYGLRPLVCVGETLEEREAGTHFDKIKAQVKAVYDVFEVEDYPTLVFAYEPIWAIGTGKTASPEQADEVHKFIRDQIAEFSSAEVAASTSILYGGSAKPSNAKELLSKKDIDGLLVGGASLKNSDFCGIIKAYSE
ncbi:MAG: triosephosphate isomerase [bacterium]|jgi:triosephosphate isomerase